MAWGEVEDTPHPAFYQSETGETLYIRDTHSHILRTEGDQYQLLYIDEDVASESILLDTGDDLEQLLEEARSVEQVGSDRDLRRYRQALEEQEYIPSLMASD